MTDLSRIDDLIERLEKSEGHNPRLEADIIRTVFTVVPSGWYGIKEPTASLDDAVALCVRLLPGWRRCHEQWQKCFRVHVDMPNGVKGYYGQHNCEPIAIVIATLRAYRAFLQSKEAA